MCERTHAPARRQWSGGLFGLAVIVTTGTILTGCGTPTAGLTPQSISTPVAEVATPAPAPSGVTAYPGPGATGRAADLARLAGVAKVDLVVDWDAYAGADDVEDDISRNLGIGDNRMDLTLEPSDGKLLPPGRALALAYEITSSAPDDFVGFNHDMAPAADWSGATALAIWVDGSNATGVDLVLQFRETSGEVWRSEQPLPVSAQPLVLPLDADTFQRADWSPSVNDRIDLVAVDQYGLYVGHTGPGMSGSARFGPIVLIR